MWERIREIIRQTCAGLGVHIIKGMPARDHVHMIHQCVDETSAVDRGTADQGPLVAPCTDGFPRVAQPVLEPAILGVWIFFHKSGNVTITEDIGTSASGIAFQA